MLSFLIALAIVTIVTVGTIIVFNLTAGRRYDAIEAEDQRRFAYLESTNR